MADADDEELHSIYDRVRKSIVAGSSEKATSSSE